MFRLLKRSAIPAIGVLAVVAASPAFAAGGCPNITAIGNFSQADNVSANFVISSGVNTNDTVTYSFSSANENPSNGVPGLIEYCIYPNQPPGNPATVTPTAVGADGTAWTDVEKDAQGFFAFKRPQGNPTNVPLDGANVQIGTAIWPVETCTPTAYAGCPGAPQTQTILLHINDPAECQALYGGTSATCFVYPTTTIKPPPSVVCNGNPACKQVDIDEATLGTDQYGYLFVPGKTPLHLHYQYIIINQPFLADGITPNPITMAFKVYDSKKTQDINSGGGKDYFGCEQIPDPTPGDPGNAGEYTNYQNTKFHLSYQLGGGKCDQSRFFLTNQQEVLPGGVIYLAPGQSVPFTIDETTRINNGGKQEYTSCGLHLLNSGFTVKWFQSDDGYKLLHSFSTNNTPIYVDVVGLPGCPAPSS